MEYKKPLVNRVELDLEEGIMWGGQSTEPHPQP